jgi:hypothetical protein
MAVALARSLPAQWPRNLLPVVRCMSRRASWWICVCEVLLIKREGLVQATQDFAIGAYKGDCKILLPVALCDSILVPGLRMSLGEGGSKVVVSVILRLAAGVWPLECRNPYALPPEEECQ